MLPRSIRLAAPLAALALALATGAALAQGASSAPVINRANMDTQVSPCDDFYRYANGTWLATAEIPASYTGIGSGREMADRNQAALYRVLEAAAAGWKDQKDADVRKLGILYAGLMDSTRANREGMEPIAPAMKRIDGIVTRQHLREEFARLSRDGFRVPVAFGPEPDPRDSRSMIAQFNQAGLGMPDRDYYFRTDPKSQDLRQAYLKYIREILTLLGTPAEQAATDADRILALETALAESSLTRVQQRDPKAVFHPMTVGELANVAPAIDWKTYLRDVGVDGVADGKVTVDVSMPSFMRQLSAQFEGQPIATWKQYLRFHVARQAAPWLSQPFFDASFAYASKLTGLKEPPPRWKRAAEACDRSMGEALGKAYVETEFPPASKQRMLEMVKNLKLALRSRIQNLDWMSGATKQQAIHKLDAIDDKIGYPDKWRDYSKLDLTPEMSPVTMLANARAFDNRRQLDQIGKPVDRSEWHMTPPTVNAYYNPTANEIVFPAGILQPPQFNPDAPDAVNYGAIGMVIGHELTHGFDDEGRQYDSDGNLKDWWQEDDSKKFDARAAQVVTQYDAYVAVDTLHLNGKLTLGENIADLGGITVAWDAWQLSIRGKPAPPAVEGFTPEQQFFLGYAQAWRRKLRPELMRMAALTDPHSSAEWRVNGPLSNFPPFAKAFGCKAGSPLVRDPQIKIW